MNICSSISALNAAGAQGFKLPFPHRMQSAGRASCPEISLSLSVSLPQKDMTQDVVHNCERVHQQSRLCVLSITSRDMHRCIFCPFLGVHLFRLLLKNDPPTTRVCSLGLSDHLALRNETPSLSCSHRLCLGLPFWDITCTPHQKGSGSSGPTKARSNPGNLSRVHLSAQNSSSPESLHR